MGSMSFLLHITSDEALRVYQIVLELKRMATITKANRTLTSTASKLSESVNDC